MKQTYIIGVIAIALLITLGVTGFVGAQTGNWSERSPGDMVEKHEAMKQAIEDRDYDAWKSIVEQKPRITDIITQENFDQFAQMHELMQQGEYEAAKEIREQLGLPDKGMKRGMKSSCSGNRIPGSCSCQK